MLFPRLILPAVCALCLFGTDLALAWDAMIVDSPALPPAFVAVDKNGGRLIYLEKQSPLAVQHIFPSIHGEVEGDKLTEGDLRTPEGVYFVTGRISGSLDFEEYGSQAYGLNYPNPVDRLRGKTGSGIWIHSKGQPIADQSTRGCIAIDLDDIDIMAPRLASGTPVLVAENVYSEAIPQATQLTDGEDALVISVPATDSITRFLTQMTEDWNKAWAARSSTMFDFYDPDSYSAAQGESFSAFRAQKESLFARLDWIQIYYGDIHVLQGPGYWVTWFEQYYHAPNLTTEGIRRLYWQPVKNGELRIVGMEWLPQNLGLKQELADNFTPDVSEFLENWRLAWQNADLDLYTDFYAENAVQDSRRGLNAIVEHKQNTWSNKQPVSIELDNVEVRLEGSGVLVVMTQRYSDSGGYSDVGRKELLLYPDGDSWLISKETWSRR